MDSFHGQNRIYVVFPRQDSSRALWLADLSSNPHLHLAETDAPDPNGWFNRFVKNVEQGYEEGFGAIVVLFPKELEANKDAILRLVQAGADDVIPLASSDAENLFQETTRYLNTLLGMCRALEVEGGIIGHSLSMQRIRKRLAKAAGDPDTTILLLGETGSGKYLAARALHRVDNVHAGHPFHAVDCGAVTDTLFGSELFGHVSGAFTGAQSSRRGAISSAGKGTLMLDEVGELSKSLQASFLNALQERKYRPVGSDRDQPISCRLVAATNRDLLTMVDEGGFRADLFFRLDGVRITLPPLRERREDIPLLFTRFVHRYLPQEHSPDVEIDDDVLALLSNCSFEGNVRQLETIARNCIASSGGAKKIRVPHLPLERLVNPPTQPNDPSVHPVCDMVESGMSWDTIQENCRKQATNSAMNLAGRLHPRATRTELIKIAAERLRVSTRSVYEWTKV